MKFGSQIIEKLPFVIGTNTKMLSRVRETVTRKIVNPQDVPASEGGVDDAQRERERELEKDWTPFERTMRRGFSEKDKNTILLMLYLARATKELLIEHLPRLTPVIATYVQQYMQNFAGMLASIASKNSGVVRGAFSDTLTKLRSILLAKDPKTARAAPHRELVELARVQVQTFINGGFDTAKRIRGEDREALERFLAETRFFTDMLSLGSIIERAYDQSALFFKEAMLAMAKGKTSFPVRTSLPLVLSEYVMSAYSKGALASAIYYPLSIYDDAASTALRMLKSRFLYDEIKAEARICLISITRLIADSVFTPMRRFCTLRLVSRKMADELRKDPRIGDAPFGETLSAVRLGTILEQNQLSVLGCKVDTKSLIADRLNELMATDLKKTVDLTDSHGALASIVVARILDILKATNDLLMNTGLPVMPFADQLSRAMATDSPSTLQSGLLANVTDHLLEHVISDFYLLTSPLRLIPPSLSRMGIAAIFGGSTGAIVEGMLLPTAAFISVESFRELFWMLDDGAIVVIHDHIMQLLPSIFNDFTKEYRKLTPRLARIADAPIAMTCAQVFDRFEGAYRYFANDQGVLPLLKVMAQIGNIVGICEMMDSAFSLKISATTQIGAFLLGKNPTSTDDKREPDLFGMFDAKFKSIREMMTGIYPIPTEEQAMQPFLWSALVLIVQHIRVNAALFDERSDNLLDMRSMTGFASRWSVLEFLFCLLESSRRSKDDAEEPPANVAVVQYGEGVLISAAIVLCACAQRPLYKLLAIADRIKSHQLTDFNALKEERVKRFFAVSDWVSAAIACAIESVQLPITKILAT
jgi:hypothetical protein